MRFGLHFQLAVADEQSPTRRYTDAIDQAVHGERLGFESVWPAEQHITPDTSILPSPLLLLAAIAARTSTLRLGTAVIRLPLSHPRRVAEDFATLDMLSGGRAECGIGRGMDPTHIAGYHAPRSETADALESGIALLRQAFASTNFAFAARFRSNDGAGRAPHPPLRLAADSPDTMRLAGRLGLPILVGLHLNTMPAWRAMLFEYREARRHAGLATQPDDITVLAPMFTAATTDEIRRAVTPGIAFLRATLQDKIAMTRAAMASGPKLDGPRAHLQRLAAGLDALDFDSLADGRAIFDTPDGCVDRVRELQDELGAGRVVGWFNMGGLLPHRRVLSAMESFAVNVMPRAQRALQLV